MKIVDHRNKSVAFRELCPGDFFNLNDKDGLFMKIYDIKVDAYSIVRALRIDDDCLGTTFSEDELVVPIKATLTLE